VWSSSIAYAVLSLFGRRAYTTPAKLELLQTTCSNEQLDFIGSTAPARVYHLDPLVRYPIGPLASLS